MSKSKIEITDHCRILKNYIFFLKGPLCQWWKSSIKEDSIVFNCCEQYMMYHKAILFKDDEVAAKILLSDEPREQKELGRSVKNFDEKIWNKNKEKIVYNGNYLKFTQNEDLKEYLIDTNPYELVEANRYDKIWGIGMFAYDDNILNTSKWGQNLLGKTLMKVRNTFIDHKILNDYKKEIAEENNYKDKYMYLLAEFDNYKKQVIKEKEVLKNNIKIDTLLPFLQINDYLEMAKIATEKSDNIDSIKYGLNMIINQYKNILTENNIVKIETKNKKFDHNFHNAIEYKSSNDVEEGYIITELKPGYLLNNKVIVPSNVIVSSGKKE